MNQIDAILEMMEIYLENGYDDMDYSLDMMAEIFDVADERLALFVEELKEVCMNYETKNRSILTDKTKEAYEKIKKLRFNL